MSLLERIKLLFAGETNGTRGASGWRSLLTEIGVTEPTCPYCDHEFPTMPQRKRKCPACGKVFYSRKRPLDGAKVLLTEAQTRENEGQSVLHGIALNGGLTEGQLDELVKEVSESLGRKPTAEEVVAAHEAKIAERYAREWQWGLYRNSRFSLAESRARQGRTEDALRLYLEVCLLDLNGPSNCATKDRAILRDYPPFNVKLAMLAPGVLQRVNAVAEELRLDQADVGVLFAKVGEAVQSELKLPRSAKKVWSELSSSLGDIKEVRGGSLF